MVVKVQQRNRHRPEEGLTGDCHRACYASILELELDDVPHFFDQGRSWEEAKPIFEEFWSRYGLREIQVAYTGDDLSLILRTLENLNPGVPFILGGRSRNEVNHSVVAWKGEIWHDPSIDQSGIVGPTEPDKLWWITYIVGEIQHLSNDRADVKVNVHE